MSNVEEALDAVVERQVYVEETYEAVSELLEQCRSLHAQWSESAGTYCNP